ncbi:MAG: hypothetical protein FWC50_02490 [Planctomycetaceae bacterium]|nr:hypothetical protein [Planctomycetaceae bacterium]
MYNLVSALKKKTGKLLQGDQQHFGLICHLSAVALAKQGQIPQAKKRWQEAKKYIDIEIIAENVKDMSSKPGFQNGPWYFEKAKLMPMFLTRFLQEKMATLPTKNTRKMYAVFDEMIREITERCPEFHRYLIKMLWDGGPDSRMLVNLFLDRWEQPELIGKRGAVLRNFAGNGRVTHEARNETAGKRTYEKRNKKALGQGKTKGIDSFLLFGQREHCSAEAPKPIEAKFQKAAQLMCQGKFKEAETLFQSFGDETSHIPSVRYNHALCLGMTGRRQEFRDAVESI